MTNVRALAQKVGFRGKALDTIVAIVMAESGGDPRAHNGNANTGDNSYGLAQINMLGAMGPERRRQYGLKSNADLFDPETNLRVAFKMSGGGKNFSPWSTYKSGAYKQHLGDNPPIRGAQAAGGGGVPNTPTDTIDAADLAAQYGWALSVLKSDKSLYSVFKKAVANTWTPERFVAELRGTSWFKTHAAAAREDQVLKATDPATWKARQYQTRALVRDMAAEMGAHLGQGALERIAANVTRFGWSDAQIRDTLAASVKAGASGAFGGQAATNIAAMKEKAFNNGVSLPQATLGKWAQRMAAGENPAGFDEFIKNMAKQTFPSFAKEIDAGMDVADLAQPYIQSYAQTLELNPADLNLFDKTLRQALQARDVATGKVGMKPLWEFEDELRADPRFDKTKQAQQTASKFADALTKTFGKVG